jgi:hypothetical protein
MATAPTERPAHVPAWKKLGLKLKYAKEDTGNENASAKNADKLANGLNGAHDSPEKVKGKKRRLDEEEEGGEVSEEESAHKTKKSKKEKGEKKEEKEKKEKKEKKRVSFSTDTKDRDGTGDESDRENGGVAVSDGRGTTSEEESTDKKNKKDKKEKKKEKKEKKDNATSGHIHETPVLSYLSLYHKNRAAWKFQKNRETHLFKHIFSLEQVPAQYNAALLAYLQGLKSEGAKQRLFQNAEEVMKTELEPKSVEDAENGDATATSQANEDGENGNAPDTKAYDNAVEEFRTWLLDPKEEFDTGRVSGDLDDDARRKFETRQRAELILFAVQGSLFSVEKPKPVPASMDGKGDQGKKKVPASKKKRKTRTAIVDISSSSESESESSSDSGSDSDSASSSGSSS